MMLKDPALEKVKNDIMDRCIEELGQHGLLLTYTVREETGHSKVRKEMIERYLVEHTERTENEKDFIKTKGLYEKYEDWLMDRFADKREVYAQCTTNSSKGFGIMVQQLDNYKGNKTVTSEGRGYMKLRWKTESTKVSEFMRKFTLKSDKRDKKLTKLNRIPMEEMRCLYWKWLDEEAHRTGESNRKEKIGETELGARLRKSGYSTNVGYINKETTNKRGEYKIVPAKEEREPYVADVKWLAGTAQTIKEMDGK